MTQTVEPAVNVRAYGAVGDGQADDTEAIQRAVEAAAGAVRFPRGVYRLTRPIQVDLDRVGPVALLGDGAAVLRMAGPGPAVRLRGTHQGTANPASVLPEVAGRQRMPVVDGLEVAGAHPEAVGFEASGTLHAVFTRLLVRSALHGIVLTGRNRNVIVSECHLYDNAGVGILMERLNLHQVNITNCHVSYNRSGGIVVRASEIRNLQIGTCDIEGNMAPGGPATANVLIDTAEGSVREGALVGCTIQHSASAPGCANVRLVGRGADNPRQVGQFSISDNVMTDAQVNIHLRHARGVTVTGNLLWKVPGPDLLVEGSSHVVVGSTLVDHHPDYGRGTGGGIVFQDSSDCTLAGVQLGGIRGVEAAVVIRRCRRFNLSGCTILDCDGVGLLLDGVEDSQVSGCLIRDDRNPPKMSHSIRLTRGQRNRLANNLLGRPPEVAPGTVEPEGVR
jgi:hypothetical protein